MRDPGSCARSLSRQFLRDIQVCQLEDLILAAGAVAPHPELTFFDQLQQAAEERILALQSLARSSLKDYLMLTYVHQSHPIDSLIDRP